MKNQMSVDVWMLIIEQLIDLKNITKPTNRRGYSSKIIDLPK
jgi:hypothetical protein